MTRRKNCLDEETVTTINKIAKYAARQVCTSHVYDYDDFVQIGVLAGIRAARRYKSGKGASLFSYMSLRIHGAIKDEIREYTLIRKDGQDSIYKDHCTTRFSQLENADTEHSFQCQSGNNPDPTYNLQVNESLSQWRKNSGLSDRDWMILLLRIGCEMTQNETGKILGCSSSRIGQIESRICKTFQIERPKSCKSSYPVFISNQRKRGRRKRAS